MDFDHFAKRRLAHPVATYDRLPEGIRDAGIACRYPDQTIPLNIGYFEE